MKVLEGKSVFSGIAIGKISILQKLTPVLNVFTWRIRKKR